MLVLFIGTDPKQGSIPAPGLYTCTITRSVTEESCKEVNGRTVVSLLECAASSLKKNLNIELSAEEIDAIKFHTTYLKYDNHEWGMCGYVDLSNEKINPKRKLTWEQIQSKYTSASKTKHEVIESTDFTPSSVAEFARTRRPELASSTKLVLVKVLKAFFAASEVEKAFEDAP